MSKRGEELINIDVDSSKLDGIKVIAEYHIFPHLPNTELKVKLSPELEVPSFA